MGQRAAINEQRVSLLAQGGDELIHNSTVHPDEFILGSLAVGTGADLAYQFVLNDERLSDVNARLNDQVYGVNDDLYGRPGPRLVEALEELAIMLHPELFP